MVDIATGAAIAGVLISAGKLLWLAISKKLDENRALDLFRSLVLSKSPYANKFVDNIINEFIPHVLENTDDEEKIRRYIAKFCILIPSIIQNSGYKNQFPKLDDIKSHLLKTLETFEKSSIEEIKKSFFEKAKKITQEIKYKEAFNFKQVKENAIEFVEKHQSDIASIKWSEKSNVLSRMNKIDEFKNLFFDSSDIKLDLSNLDHQYIDNYVTGVIDERIPPMDIPQPNIWIPEDPFFPSSYDRVRHLYHRKHKKEDLED